MSKRHAHPLKIAAFASGRGSNIAAIYNSIQDGRLNAEIVCVVSNKTEAGALEVARQNAIPAFHISREEFETTEDFDSALLQTLKKHRVDFIVLAGYLKKIGSVLIREFKHRILNIHPALLPAFGGKGMFGLKVHQAVLDYGCKISGVTVHLVDEEYDSGPPVLQKCVPVKDGDTAESLAKRVLHVEHEIFPEALRLFADGLIEVRGRQVEIKKLP